MRALHDRVRFVVVTLEDLDPALGTTTPAHLALTPYVYQFSSFLDPALYASFFEYLLRRFEPRTLWIANGATWIYNALPEIKARHPSLRILNMVYDQAVGWINRYDLSLILHLDGHLGVNERICQAYLEKGARPETVYQIENGIEPAEFNPAAYTPEKITALKLGLGLPLDRKVITFASRVHPQKRPMDFVELARRMADEPGLIFLMVGDGPLANQVDAQITRSGLKNILRQPFYRPLSDIFAISDVFVLPSDFEGMPMVILEAQAMGVPVVVTDVGNNRSVLAVTGGGVVVGRPGDVAALMAGVRKLLAAPPPPAALRQAFLSRYDIALVAEQYLAAFLGNPDIKNGS
jgi:glycosyltransferase involved in cell wall biosynthesis